MRRIDDEFDRVDTWDATYGPAEFADGNLRIPVVSNLLLMPGHPLNSGRDAVFINDCVLLFEGVTWSRRTYARSNPDQHTFTKGKIVDDVSPHEISMRQTAFRIAGADRETGAIYDDWTIIADRFALLVPDGPLRTRATYE